MVDVSLVTGAMTFVAAAVSVVGDDIGITFALCSLDLVFYLG